MVVSIATMQFLKNQQSKGILSFRTSNMSVLAYSAIPMQRMLKLKPDWTDLLTSWSGRLSKPTCPPSLRFLTSELSSLTPLPTVMMALVPYLEINKSQF